MPMQLPKCAFLQVLLGRGDVVALRQIRDYLLPDPTTVEDACLGVAEAPLQIGHDAVVSGLLAQVVRVLDVQSMVCPP